MQKDLFFLLNKISQSIFDKKGSNILALDVRPSGSFSDFVIIAEGNVDKHTIAIAESVEKAMEEEGGIALMCKESKRGIGLYSTTHR